ncbi:NAD(P)-dependent oxidoreductase [Actinopolymorpha sp. B11F2]|uniref:NAD(P)-dependent oxidoreductase n=1 Tax=Actinopolymorpha sp. B11F2 TaxID=3160862 RepID=UPI0032E42EFD
MTDVGWVGLGAMGSPMASCLAAAGHHVTAYDIDPARAEALADAGVRTGTSAAAVADGAEVLAIMVATPDQAESVLFGAGAGEGDVAGTGQAGGGAAAALAAGSVVLVLATVGPAAVRSWAHRLAERGVELVDAPVSGGTARAAAGELVAMVSGPEAAVTRVQPLLDVLASRAPLAGPTAGDGQKVKLVNQLLCGVHIAVAAEALAFAEAIGLDAGACWEIIRHGAAASFILDDRGERMLHGPFDQPRSALDIFVKDMGLVTDAARAADYPTPLATTAEQLYLAGRRAGLGRLDDSAVIELLRGKHEGAGA